MSYTLDQLLVFVTVADSGGFAAAARELGRAQSAVTYAIRALEQESGLLLFDRTGYRAALLSLGARCCVCGSINAGGVKAQSDVPCECPVF